MGIEFDPRKSARDEAERQLPFERAVDFERSEAIIIPDERNDYPESRFVTVGYLDTRLHVLCFTPIEGEFGLLVFVKPTGERLANMGNHLPLIDEEGEVRELTKEDFARARPASEVLPEILGPEVAAEFLKPKPPGPRLSAQNPCVDAEQALINGLIVLNI